MLRHKRDKIVRDAEQMVRQALFDHTKNLTEGEYLRVVCAVFGDAVSTTQIQAMLKIRHERHGDSDTPGGLAPAGESKNAR